MSIFSTYDIVCGVILVIAVLYGLSKGFINMLKPIISIVIARLISGYVRSIMSAGSIATIIAKMAAEKTGLPDDYKVIQMGASLVSETIISVLAFVISYILIRLVITIVFSSLKFVKRGSIFRCDRVVGGLIGFVVVSVFFYYANRGLSALVYLGFIELSEIRDGFSTSLVSRIIIGMTKKVFENISIWV